jgi:integrase
MIRDLRVSLRTALTSAGIARKVTWHTFRHTYTAARMQTLDHGQPVSPYTVMRELGHSSLKQIEETYGHLQQTRLRRPVVEYREVKVLTLGVTADILGTVAGTESWHQHASDLPVSAVSA